jgi:hypothetical protein
LIAIKISQEFLEALFNGMNVEAILGEAEVCSRHARVTVQKGHNFCSDRWIMIKILQEFLEALFNEMDVES